MSHALLAGKDVGFYAKHTTITENVFKLAVCATDTTLNRAKTETTVITKCGSVTTPGTDDDSIDLSVAFITDEPLSGELGASELEDIYASGDQFEWILADTYPSSAILNKSGFGVITALSEPYPAEGLVIYQFTIKVNGTITKNL